MRALLAIHDVLDVSELKWAISQKLISGSADGTQGRPPVIFCDCGIQCPYEVIVLKLAKSAI